MGPRDKPEDDAAGDVAASGTTRAPKPELLSAARVYLPTNKAEFQNMARDLLLWLLGVPIGVIILLHLFGELHW